MRLGITIISLLVILISGCGWNPVYKTEQHQGNYVTQSMINQLEPGMSKEQVRFVMGTPLLVDAYHPDQWHYLFRHRDKEANFEEKRMILHFEGNQLAHMEGTYRPE